jgi:phytoene dehydrogenase-like protein
MGAITQAIAKECAARGVEVLTGAAVERVLVRDGRATGAVLADGREFTARVLASNLHPKTLLTRLVPAEALDADVRARIARHRNGSGTFRMNVALSELPDFLAAPGTQRQDHHASGILVGHSLAYFERAFFDARSKEHNPGWAREPIVEMVISSTLDDTLAPAGRHVASLFCQHVNPQVDGGWDAHRETVAQRMIDTVDRVAPNFRRSVLGYRALSPLDLEREFGLVGGDIFHGSLGLDQMFSARPLLGLADYRTPVRGLYLCGAGAHPGGGVTGVPGMNAAREIVKDITSRRA